MKSGFSFSFFQRDQTGSSAPPVSYLAGSRALAVELKWWALVAELNSWAFAAELKS